jgi:hypothetical protein
MAVLPHEQETEETTRHDQTGCHVAKIEPRCYGR